MPQRDDFAFMNLQEWDNRIRVAIGCRDCDDMPRVANAGKFDRSHDQDVQIMHNGIKVLKDGYIGQEQSQIIQFLRGVHEPQEEKVFSEVLPYMPSGAVMVELGCWWAYYSLWFNKSVPDARNYCVEPDAGNLEIGIHNFIINNASATFVQAGVANDPETRNNESFKTNGNVIYTPANGRHQHANPFAGLENIRRAIPAITIDSFMADHKIDFIDLLHVDIQLAEVGLLQSSPKAFGEKRMGYIFVSTHAHPDSWHSEWYDKYHYECLKLLRDVHGYHIVAEHSVSDSYSGDGMIVAKIPGYIGPDHVEISKLSKSDFALRPKP